MAEVSISHYRKAVASSPLEQKGVQARLLCIGVAKGAPEEKTGELCEYSHVVIVLEDGIYPGQARDLLRGFQEEDRPIQVWPVPRPPEMLQRFHAPADQVAGRAPPP